MLINKNQRAFPIDIRSIYQGDVRTFENPITHELSNSGNGIVLYERSAKMNCPYFILVRTVVRPKMVKLKTFKIGGIK